MKGYINISNIDNTKTKSLISDFNIINNSKNIDLSNNIVLKNSGLYKYGFIEIYCVEQINNKYIWNINSKLLNNNQNNINQMFN